MIYQKLWYKHKNKLRNTQNISEWKNAASDRLNKHY